MALDQEGIGLGRQCSMDSYPAVDRLVAPCLSHTRPQTLEGGSRRGGQAAEELLPKDRRMDMDELALEDGHPVVDRALEAAPVVLLANLRRSLLHILLCIYQEPTSGSHLP